jgi:ribose 5-phosphate isomerase RpiB
VEEWLSCNFEGGGSPAKVERIKQYERTHAAEDGRGCACD